METFHRTFVDNVYEAYIQKLPNTFNRNSNKSSKTLKLRFLLKMGPITLKYEMYFAPANLTKTTVSNVEKYLKDNDSGKAYREGKSSTPIESSQRYDTAKPKAKRTLGRASLPANKSQLNHNPQQHKVLPLTMNDIDMLSDITNGKCGPYMNVMNQPHRSPLYMKK